MNENSTTKIALNIKNDYTLKMVDMIFENMDFDVQELYERVTELGIHENGQSVTGAFVLDLLTTSANGTSPLDLSYDTVNELIPCAADTYNHNISVNEMDPELAERLFCRMVAAYLIYLCANEHGCELEVNRLPYPPSEEEDEKYWASCLEVRIGNKSKVDFLVAAIEGMNCGHIWYSVAPLVEAYKKATGVDLSEKGFCDIFLGNVFLN